MLYTIVPMFVTLAATIVGVGILAMWAEFKCSGDRYETTHGAPYRQYSKA